MPKANIKMKYKDCGTMKLLSFLQRLGKVQASNKTAGFIRHVLNEANRAQKQISQEYVSDLMEKFGTKGEDGKVIHNQDAQMGYEVAPDLVAEFTAAQEEFDNREFTFEWGPFRPAHFAEIKVSAEELESLGALYTEEDGPSLSLVGD